MELRVEDNPDPLDIDVLEAQIRGEASVAMGLGEEVELAIFVRDAGEVVAGISGWTRALYERSGYELAGRVEDFPSGTDVLWYRKRLVADNGSTEDQTVTADASVGHNPGTV